MLANHRKVAVVTGGASGIGRAMARYFVNQHYGHVAILDVDSGAGPRVAAEIAEAPATAGARPSPTRVRFLQCDVASWASQTAAFAQVHEQCGGRIDVVMANAGISEGGESSLVAAALGRGEDAARPPSEPSMRTINVNLLGGIYTTKLAIQYLKKNEPAPAAFGTPSRGAIICTASNAGLYPFPVAPLYAASKFGLIGFVRAMARPLERAAIQIHSLAPAVLETNIAPSKALFEAMAMTPMATLVRGVDQILTGAGGGPEVGNVSGAVAEIHGDCVTFRAAHEYADADSARNLETFWSLGYA